MKMTKVSFEKVSNWLSEVSCDEVPKDLNHESGQITETAQSKNEHSKEVQNMKSEELYAKIKNVSLDEAKTACAKLRTQISALLPGSDAETIEETLYMKLKTSGSGLQGDKADVVLVAMGPYKDNNFPKKQKALNLYRDDISVGITAETLAKLIENPKLLDPSKIFVRIDETGKAIPIDNTQFFGNPPDPKRKNPNFLKDIEEDPKRDAVFITSAGACVQGSGKFDGEVGQIAHIVGKLAVDDKGVVTRINVYKGGWKVDDVMEPAELWSQAYDALSDSPLSVPIESVWDVDNYKMVAVKGRVSAALVMKQGAGGPMIALTDIGLDEDVVAYGDETHVELKAQMDDIEKGSEAIVFGTVNKYTAKDGTPKKSLNFIGVLINPESSALASALDKLSGIDI